MNNIHLDWRWVGLIAVVAIIALGGRLPWFVTVLVLGGGGAYLLQMGWRTITRSGGGANHGKVTYWRGQRIEVAPARRGPTMPRMRDLGPALVPLLLGGVMVLAAGSILLRYLGV